jgi:hypothetical protein
LSHKLSRGGGAVEKSSARTRHLAHLLRNKFVNVAQQNREKASASEASCGASSGS